MSHHLHFTVKDIKDQRGLVSFPRLQSGEVVRPWFKPIRLTTLHSRCHVTYASNERANSGQRRTKHTIFKRAALTGRKERGFTRTNSESEGAEETRVPGQGRGSGLETTGRQSAQDGGWGEVHRSAGGGWTPRPPAAQSG